MANLFLQRDISMLMVRNEDFVSVPILNLNYSLQRARFSGRTNAQPHSACNGQSRESGGRRSSYLLLREPMNRRSRDRSTLLTADCVLCRAKISERLREYRLLPLYLCPPARVSRNLFAINMHFRGYGQNDHTITAKFIIIKYRWKLGIGDCQPKIVSEDTSHNIR